jgi:hypothetical protein
MPWVAELSDAGRHSESISQEYELAGVDQIVMCGLDTDSRNTPIGFAASLARRLGWRLSLVPLPEAATQDERLGRLLAAAKRDRAGLVVTEAVRTGAGAAAFVELSRSAACPLIAVPPGSEDDAALLAVGAPSGEAATPDGVVAAILRDSHVPVMLVPGGTAVPRTGEAA